MSDKVANVLNALETGKRFTSGALLVIGGKVFSYDVCIAELCEGPPITVHIDATKYSVTTSGHQNVVRRACKAAGFNVVDQKATLGKLGRVG